MLDAKPHPDVRSSSDGPIEAWSFPEQPTVRSLFPTRREIIRTLTITDVLEHTRV